jgi:hypothetical protein
MNFDPFYWQLLEMLKRLCLLLWHSHTLFTFHVTLTSIHSQQTRIFFIILFNNTEYPQITI